jgi:hypothetical protein
MAYGFGKPTDWDTLLVFDLGGGTLDLSLLEVFDGIMEVGGRAAVQMGLWRCTFHASACACARAPTHVHTNTHTPVSTHRTRAHYLHGQVVETGGDAMLGGDDFTAAAVAMVTSALPDGVRAQLAEGR